MRYIAIKHIAVFAALVVSSAAKVSDGGSARWGATVHHYQVSFG
jgi:hypothetical protein